jgi:hypothetical protein
MKNVSINHQPSFSAVSSINGENEFVYSTNHALDVIATISGNPNVNIAQIAGNSVSTAATGIIKVGLADGSGNSITSTGGKLDVNATFSGTVNSAPTFSQDPGDATPVPAYGLIDSSFRPQVSIATSLPVGSNAIGSITNTAFTANAGTNLNTSALALESGGNLATLAGTVSSSKVNVNISSGNPTSIAVTQSTSPWIVAGGGIAGSAATGVLTVQGITSMTPILATVTGTVTANISGSISNTSFIATQSAAANLNATVVGTGTFAVQNTPAAPTTIYSGKTAVTTAGTRVVLTSSQAIQSVTIKALSTNTGIIYVGNSSVASTNGLQLLAGESVSMDIANLTTVNIDSSVNGEGVTYVGVN